MTQPLNGQLRSSQTGNLTQARSPRITTDPENPLGSSQQQSRLSTSRSRSASSNFSKDTGAAHQPTFADLFDSRNGVTARAWGNLCLGLIGATSFRLAYNWARGRTAHVSQLKASERIGVNVSPFTPLGWVGGLIGATAGGIVHGCQSINNFCQRGGLHLLFTTADYERARDELLVEIMDDNGAQGLQKYDTAQGSHFRQELETVVRNAVDLRCDHSGITKLDVRTCIEQTVALFGKLEFHPRQVLSGDPPDNAVAQVSSQVDRLKKFLNVNGDCLANLKFGRSTKTYDIDFVDEMYGAEHTVRMITWIIAVWAPFKRPDDDVQQQYTDDVDQFQATSERFMDCVFGDDELSSTNSSQDYHSLLRKHEQIHLKMQLRQCIMNCWQQEFQQHATA